MKKLFTFSFLLILFGTFHANAQTFWTENFESSSSVTVDGYTGPNGPWTNTVTGIEGANPNVWYVSCAEGGNVAGVCGAPCTGTDLGSTLHLSSDPSIGGDLGAAYFTGGCFTYYYYSYSYTYGICAQTDKRAESPEIDCSAKSNITLSYYYIENGDGSVDNGEVWYFDGTTWNLLEDPPKTVVCPSGQGQWAHRTKLLPASANHNAHVKIGFRWVNDEDGFGTDPSFAVDSVSLSAIPPPVATFTVTNTSTCKDSCVVFTSTSTIASGTIDSFRWSMPGMTIATPHATPLTLCFPATGSYTMHLYVYGNGLVDSTMQVITVNPPPHPTITHTTGRTLTAGSGYTMYQWGRGIPPTPISGATSGTYTYTVSGTYSVAVDSGGCWGWDTITVSTVGVSSLSGTDNKYWVVQQASGGITINAANPLTENISVSMFDVSGRLLFEDIWREGTGTKQINDVSIPPGTCIIKLTNGKTSEILKFIKQ